MPAAGGRTVVGVVGAVGVVTGAVVGVVAGAVRGVVVVRRGRVVEVVAPDPPDDPLQAAPSATSDAATQKHLQGCGRLVD